MKILLLANHFNTGGITSYLLTLTRAFIGQGHEVIVASSSGNMVAELKASGARHIDLAFNVKCEVHPRLLFLVPRLAAVVREERIDVIHAQTRVTQVCAELVSRLCRVACISTCHGFFRFHLGRNLWPAWGTKVIAISAPVKQHLRRDLYVPEEMIALIPNGVDLARFVPLEPEERSVLRGRWGLKDEPAIGIVARLSDVKGHQFLVRAMPEILARFPNAKCLVFGSGPMEDELKNLVHENGLDDNVLFYPVINRTCEVLPLLDVFVMPSLQEGLGLSVLEAAAMGLPAVVSRVGGLPGVVLEGETGWLVEPQDVAGLARAIISLLADPAGARKMGAQAREFVARNFAASVMAEHTMAVYKSAAG
ncbi:MAG: glycosyltransferase family 4 protein [Candidatus Omnitrophica bacterium]|nr:glycosyltransferase family 4 protein [Candidatus Omnitrophota bacterium]